MYDSGLRSGTACVSSFSARPPSRKHLIAQKVAGSPLGPATKKAYTAVRALMRYLGEGEGEGDGEGEGEGEGEEAYAAECSLMAHVMPMPWARMARYESGTWCELGVG